MKKMKKFQFFRPKDKKVIKRTPAKPIREMAKDTIINCESWKNQKKEEWKRGEISEKEYKDQVKKQDKMISDAKKTILEVKKKG